MLGTQTLEQLLPWLEPRTPQLPLPDHARHLGEPDETKLLGQEGVVAQADLGPDGLVDGTVAKVHLWGVELQV